ncbi:MAG: PQQ-binding-like beta-propeller repeat protein [Chloroflexi bacterium]|nr:PQQ-binding-like beta-propeller repeat protein [Chloroflexota bacterium]
MVDTKQFASEPKKDLLGVDGTLQLHSVLMNRYRITGVLGVGGMGSVYQARDLQFPSAERYVAVKEMLNLSQDPQLRTISLRNFEREANILAALSHPAIPTIHEYFTHKDRAYLVMEQINGKNLEEILNTLTESLPVDMVVQWAIDLCDVLNYLHDHDPPIIFRDMKPANIMIDSYGRLRLIDFGIARTFQVGEKGTMIGTEGYSAPEQYRGEATPQSDIYGLGATLHHSLTGRDPRLEAPFTFADRPIREANPDVPGQLDAIIMRALAFEPSQRFANVLEMKKLFEAVRYGASGGGSVAIDSGAAPAQEMDDWGSAEAGGIDVRWKFKVEEEIRASPIVHDGIVFFGAYDHNLWAIDTENGQMRWKYATEAGISTDPAIHKDGNMVVVGSDDYAVYAIDIRSGRENWKLMTQGPVRSSPTVAHGHVFFGSDDGHLYATRLTTGRSVWKYDAGVPIRSKPTVTDELIIFGAESGDVYAVDLSGQLKWRFKCKRNVISSPFIYEGLVYFGSFDYHLYAIDIKNGWSVWRYRTAKPVLSSPIVADEMVFFGSADGNVYALDAFGGRERWKFATENQVISSPVYADGAIYIASVDGKVYSLDAKKGKERWSFETNGPISGSPYVHEGVLYIGSTDQNLYALKA